MSWMLLIIICLYATLIGEFAVGSWRLPTFFPKKEETFTGFTIIIPFRNEVSNLPKLLTSLRQLDYPNSHYEILLINDDSQDTSKHIVLDHIDNYPYCPIRCIDSVRVTGSPKKDALSLGIRHAKHPWIITTDADCTFPSSWLKTLSSFIISHKPKMIAGPVVIATSPTTSFLNAFEQLDFLSLQGATIGGFGMQMPFLCNAAHLAYEKEAFLMQGGFSDNEHIASGDDHFLLEKFARAYPSKVRYLNSPKAIVTTTAQPSWKQLIRQRVRWASKAPAYQYWFSKAVGILVLIANSITAALLVYLPIHWFAQGEFIPARSTSLLAQVIPVHFLITLLLKWSVDFFLIASTAQFFNRKSYLLYYPILMIVYPFLNVYMALKSLFVTYEWKGRQF